MLSDYRTQRSAGRSTSSPPSRLPGQNSSAILSSFAPRHPQLSVDSFVFNSLQSENPQPYRAVSYLSQWRLSPSRSSFNPEVCISCNSPGNPTSFCLCLWMNVGKPIKKLPKEIRIAPNASTQGLHNALAEASGYSVHRLRITKGSDRSLVPNSKNTTIQDTGLNDKSLVHVKDLGMSATLCVLPTRLVICADPCPSIRPPDWMAHRFHH